MHVGLAVDYGKLSELRALRRVNLPMLAISGLILLQLVKPVEVVTIWLDGCDLHV
jgi:hypothetical protein